MVSRYAKDLISAFLAVSVLWGCSGNGTGVDEGEPPQIPEITAAQPDFSYFDDSPKAVSEIQGEHAYGYAQSTAQSARFLFAFGQMTTSYFQLAENQQAVYKEGKWIWSYSAFYEGRAVEFKLAATVNEAAEEARWELFISGTGGEKEVQDLKYMEGTTSLDGSSGDWKIYDYSRENSSEPVLSYKWSADADGNTAASFNFNSNSSYSAIDYVQQGSTHKLILSGSGASIELYWDTDSDRGYWWDKEENQKLCWTSNKSDIECSEIGF